MHALTILCKLAGKFLSSFTLNIYSLRWLKVWWLQELLSRSKWSMWCASPKNDLTTATALPLWQLLQFTGLMLSGAPLQGMLKICSAVLRWPNKNVVCNLIHTHTHRKKKKQQSSIKEYLTVHTTCSSFARASLASKRQLLLRKAILKHRNKLSKMVCSVQFSSIRVIYQAKEHT